MPASIRENRHHRASAPHSPRVLLLVDYINPLDFPGAEELAPRALQAARAVAALKEALAEQGVATVYANDNYGAWQSDFRFLVEDCQRRDGAAGDIARLLAPRPADLTVLKPRHSAFYGSPLELLLAEMDATELVICGLATDMCVQMTAADAFLREFRCWIPEDCSAAESTEAHLASMRYMASVLKCDTRASMQTPLS
ncbi:cysteine hydrolase family protein [Ramlibacter rhizophilus]|uniref:Cysteine hydrolase n=1 Tax=Ramlibacter rhizophilus TaxID=1781167 RepID=A0A4Z0BH03_9BURK|nr:isochorismatase family cysteine hydrolase [Ramlibacter rhizophilus]TFY98080.1 cysteine hydrolase [Ramlibacter rhizophilus]